MMFEARRRPGNHINLQMLYIIFFFLGLIWGSFMNVVVFRFKEGEFIFGRKVLSGRSHCRHCGKTLSWYELLPLLSFIIQFGRCRACGRWLSFQYPIVEALSGLLFLGTAYYFFSYHALDFTSIALKSQWWILGATVIWAAVFFILLLLSVIDYREYLVPDETVYAIFGLAALWVLWLFGTGHFGLIMGSFLGAYANLFGLRHDILSNHLFAAFVGFAAIALIFFLSRGRAIGFGDVKLLAVLGLLFGWPDIVIILGLAFVIGAAVSLALLAKRQKGIKDFVPFAPFIALSSFLVFFYGSDIVRLYFYIFNPLY